MKDELINDLTVALMPYVENTQDLKLLITMVLGKYEVQKAETSLIVYEGDINEQMLKRFIAAKMAKGCSMRTIELYRQSITFALQGIGKPYMDITPDDIRYWLALRIRRDGITKTTANNYRRNLSAFYSWLKNEDIIAKNPLIKVDSIKETKKKPKAYTLLDLEKIRMGCRTNRERAMVEFLASTWCRITETVNVKLYDIDNGRVTVHGKGDKYRDVFLNARAQLAIDAYLAERKDNNPYLFPRAKHAGDPAHMMKGKKSGAEQAQWYKDPSQVDKDRPMDQSSAGAIVKKIGERVRVDHVHPHRFRRTGATLALRAGMPLTTVSKLLGHESIETTQIYLDISDEELEAAHKKFVV